MMFKKIMKPTQILKNLSALLVGATLAMGALADGATATVGYSTFNAQVVAGSTDTIGSPTSYRAGDTIQWTGVYSAPTIDYPQWKEHTILFPGGQPYVKGQTKAMYGYSTVYKVSGGWTTLEPANDSLIEGVKFTYKPKESVLTSPPAPKLNFTGGGDGFEVTSYQGKLYVVNHHETRPPIKCFDATTGNTCLGWEPVMSTYNCWAYAGSAVIEKICTGSVVPKKLDTDVLRFKTVQAPMGSLNRENGNFWFVVSYHDKRDGKVRNGFLCYNLLITASCGFVEVDNYVSSYANFVGPPYYFQTYTSLAAVGSKLFSISNRGNLGCVDSSTGQACILSKPGPYKLPPSLLNINNISLNHIPVTVAGDKILFMFKAKMHCIDSVSGDQCLGSWPKDVFGQGNQIYGPRLVLHPDGTPKAACMGYGPTNQNVMTRLCFDFTGQPYTLTPIESQLSNLRPQANHTWDSVVREMSYKTRTFNFDNQDNIECFDFALGAACPNFPKNIARGRGNYTVVPDPERFDCMWTNADSGQNGFAASFDAMGATKCSGSPNPPMTLISKPRTAYLCTDGTPPKPQWRSIALSADAGITVTAKIYNAITTNLISTRTIPVGQRTVSIADINFETHPELKVELTLSGQIGNEKAVAADIVWDGPEQQFCAKTKPSAASCLASADWFGSSGLVGTTTPNYSKTINGRGLSLSALLDGFNIAAAVSSIHNEDKPLIFRARFDEKTLSGEMTVARRNDTTGLPGDTLATASGVMSNAMSRTLLTQLPNGSSVSMRWNSLSSDQKAQLNKKLSGVDDTKGEARLNFLRGETSDEGGTAGLRVRSLEARKLGMVVSSGTVYLPPRALMGYSEVQEPGYADFIKNPIRKNGMVFLAANDGFLHGFKVADNGETNVALTHQFGFFPKRLFNEVQRYTDGSEKSLRGQPYFNDNTPMIADIKLGGSFATVLVNPFGRGAQGFVALNVTNADTVTENTSNLAIREFTEKDDADMGYIISQPAVDDLNYTSQITQVKRAGVVRPAVIMGNGINSRNARGALFVVYLDATGGYDKLVFDGLNNGLSTPRVMNLDANANTIADKLYVGDLLGNMWSVDITDTSNMIATKLFAADAPIVSAPVVKRYQPLDLPTCTKCFMVNFATGKPTVSPLLYDFNPGQHTAYGILDKGATATVNVNSLVKQTILGIVNGPNGPNKVVSQEKVEYKTGKLGWYFPLPVGEMVVANPKYRPGGSVVFFSLSPPGLTGTTCTARSGWTYNLVATNGHAQSGSFDTNRDGKINSADMVSLNGKNSYPGGEASEGIMGNVQLTSSANSNVESIVKPDGGRELIGSALNAPRRLNWQELDNR